MEASLRALRVVHGAMLVAVLLYVWIGEQIGPKAAHDVALLQLVLALVSASTVAAALVLCRKMTLPAEAALRSNSQDAAALQRWRGGYIVSFAISESIALFGLVLRVLGGSLRQSLPFYLAAVVLLLILRPSAPH